MHQYTHYLVWIFLGQSLLKSDPLAAAAIRQIRPFFEDAFDLGAGGATLTWSTQESQLFNNPALLPYGGKLLRWLGGKTTLSPGTETLSISDTLQSSSSDSTSSNPIEPLFQTPVHLGASQAFSFISNNFGVAFFANAEPDLRAWRRGTPDSGGGTSQLHFRSESYGGAVASFAGRVQGADWLSFGLTAKQLYRLEVDQTLDIVSLGNTENLATLTQSLAQSAELGTGTAIDIGSLIFLQGKHLDWRIAAVQANAGGLRFSNGENSLPAMLHGGVGVSLHTAGDAIHLAADLKDIQGATNLPTYKRVYAGVKIMLRGILGLSAGVHHGHPSYGAAFDFFLFRLAGSVYTREYHDTPGVDARPITMFSFVTGTDF
ncbi:MAG: hypothetical protein OXT67_09420 [Zetaproteobacteria bacterium]|nr:hypothetical protein [Zetaproteobacteria bacterium]